MLVIFLAFVTALFFILPWEGSSEDLSTWHGQWKFYYFYHNDSSLTYRGDLSISSQDDSIVISLAVKPPKSSRSEQLVIDIHSHSENQITGTMTHDRYLIKGGHLTEEFDWRLESSDRFTGSGSCIKHCAEGTEQVAMTWHGEKVPNIIP